MKKILSFALVVAMLFSFASMASATSYRDTVDGIKMSPGFNPVVKFIGDNKYEYTLYAVEMDGITDADLVLDYPDNVLVDSFRERGDFDMCVTFDTGEALNVSFMYTERYANDAFKLFTITFSYTGEPAYPRVKVKNLAGTYMRSVADIVFKNEPPVQPEVMLGDVNGDGKITANDARLVLRHSAQIELLPDTKAELADVNKDGKVTSTDARLVLRVASQLDKGFQ